MSKVCPIALNTNKRIPPKTLFSTTLSTTFIGNKNSFPKTNINTIMPT